MGGVFKDFPGRAREHDAHRGACGVKIAEGENFLPDFGRAGGLYRRQYFDKVARDGFARRLPRLQQLALSAPCGTRSTNTSGVCLRARHDQDDEVPGYFLIVWTSSAMRASRGFGGPGAARGGQLVAYCMRITDVDPPTSISSSSGS